MERQGVMDTVVDGDRAGVGTLADLLRRAARAHPDRAAFVLPGTRRSYGELLAGAERVRRGLLALGIGAGDHVGVLAPNSVEYVEAICGISLLGGVVVPLNVRLKNELGDVIRRADLRCLLTSDVIADHVDFTEVLYAALPSLAAQDDPSRLALPEAPMLHAAVMLVGEGRPGFVGAAAFDRLATGAVLDEAGSGDVRSSPAMILFTSGTTSHPKGCVLSHDTLLSRAVRRAEQRLSAGGRDVFWSAGPLFHVASLQLLLGCIGIGGTYVTDTYFEPGRALQQIEHEQPTAFWPWFPAIMEALLGHPDFRAEAFSSVRAMGMIGSVSLLEQVQDLFPQAVLMQSSGMSEAAGIYAFAPPGEPRALRAISSGVPEQGVEVRLIGPEDGEERDAPGTGELLLRGMIMDGYYKADESFDADGWLHTGDLYEIRSDGTLVYRGRTKDMLKVGGENVAALEVETFLMEHPEVKMAEVVGVADPKLDEVPVAFIERHPGATIAEADILAFCRGRIANFKVPRAVYFIEAGEWPMSATKVNKDRLRERAAERDGS